MGGRSTRFDKTTPSGFKFTVQVDDLGEGRAIVQVLEDLNVLWLPWVGHNFFADPLKASVGRFGDVVWDSPFYGGRLLFPHFCDVLEVEEVDEWVDLVAPLVEEEILDEVEDVRVRLVSLLDAALGDFKAGNLGKLRFEGTPDAWRVVLDEGTVLPTLWVWGFHPLMLFDPENFHTLDHRVAVTSREEQL